MAWWAGLLLIIAILLLLFGMILLLPLRIFITYLRENKKDEIGLRIKLGWLVLRFKLWKTKAGEKKLFWYLAGKRIEIPPVLLEKLIKKTERFTLRKQRGKSRWRVFVNRSNSAEITARRRQARSWLKKISWSRFDLEIMWGWDEPALAGLAAGSCWALGGILTGLLHEYFSMAARPRFQVRPLFRPAELRLRWEGEAVLSLYRWFRLWHALIKTGGVASGTSSH